MSRQRLWLFIGLGIGVFLIVGLFIYLGVRSSSQGDGVITDRDTGESRELDPTSQQETGAAAVDEEVIIVFGLEDLSTAIRDGGDGTTGKYFSSIRKAIWAYSSERLTEDFSSVTLRPQDTVVTGREITSTLRLGQTDQLVPIKIVVSDNKKAAVVTINEAGTQYGGTFIYVSDIEADSFLYSIVQINSTSTDLRITAYPGNRESALNYIESLGYHVPDFSITFSDYRSPF